MSDENTADDETIAPAEEADTDVPVEPVQDDTDADDDENPDDSNDGKEAARWRRKLREAEKQRDAFATRVEALQRSQAEAMLTATGVKPQAVWAVAELASLLAEDGTVDRDKLDAAVVTARERFGIAKPAKGTVVPGIGNKPNVLPRRDEWKSAFAPSRKR